MTPKEIFSLGVAKSQIFSAMELLDQSRKNLNFAQVNELDGVMKDAYNCVSWLDNELSEIIEEKVK